VIQAIGMSGSSLYVAGSFTSYRGLPALNLAKLDLQSGALDQAFTAVAGADGPLLSLAISVNSVYVSGNFSHYRGAAIAPWGPAKIDLNSGELDPSFRPPAFFSGRVTALLYLGSSLYVASQVDMPVGVSTTAGFTIVKLDAATGARDAQFNAPLAQPNATIFSLVASGTSIYAGGYFSMPNGTAAQTHFAKLDATTGQLDSSFNHSPYVDYAVQSVAVVGSNVYLVGGFHRLGSLSSPGIMKLDATSGTADPSFGLTPGFGGTPLAVVAGSGVLYVDGTISGYGGTPASNIAKLDAASGVADTAFNTAAGTDGEVYKILVSGSSLYLGGYFSKYGGIEANLIAKADATTGVPDTTFLQGGGFSFDPPLVTRLCSPSCSLGSFSTAVNALALNGTSLYVGGRFTNYRGEIVADLAKLDADSGALDPTFVQGQGFLAAQYPSTTGYPTVTGIAFGQNALYVAGNFVTYRGVPAEYVLKLNPASGAADTAFNSPFVGPAGISANPYTFALAVSAGSLYVGSVPMALGANATSTGLCKLDAASGVVDMAFTQAVALTSIPGAVASVTDLAVSGSSLYVAGEFQSNLGSGRAAANNLVELNTATGSIDTTFTQPGGPNREVSSLFLGSNVLYIAGPYSTYRGKFAAFSAALEPSSGADQDAAE
jgi:trimeric autotransporter adhesin